LFSHLNGEAEQYLVAAVCWPGNAPGSAGAHRILRVLIARVGEAFPKRKSGASRRMASRPGSLDFLDCEPKVEYLVNMAPMRFEAASGAA